MKSILYFVILGIFVTMMSLLGILTVQGLQNYHRNYTAVLFAMGQQLTKSRVDSQNRGNSDCMFNFEGACSLNARVNTSVNATCNNLDINNMSVNLCCNTGNWCTILGSRINLGINGVTTDCSNISMNIGVLSVTCSGSSINCADHERNCTETAKLSSYPTNVTTFTAARISEIRFTSKTPTYSNFDQTEPPLSQLPSTVNSKIVNVTAMQATASFSLYYSSTFSSGTSSLASRRSQHTMVSPMMNSTISLTSFNNISLPILTKYFTTSSNYKHENGTNIHEVHVTPTTASIATSVSMPSQTTWTSKKLTSGETSTHRHQTQSPSRDLFSGTNLQTTVPATINLGTTFQTDKNDKNDTQISKASHGTDFNPLTGEDWITFAMTDSTTSSNCITKQTQTTEPSLDNILGTNSTNATSTESPDMINIESALKSMYTFLAVFGVILLAVFILVCVCFFRTKSPKSSQNMSTNDLWSDKDVIQRHHSTDFSPYTPYCINPVYKDYFDERSNTHVRKQNSYGETVCRVRPPIPTLPTHCCSGQSDWSLPPTESPIPDELTMGDICSLSYMKTDYYIDNISGHESDV